MKRSTIGWIGAGFFAVAAAGLAWLFFFAGGSGEPSTQLTVPELAPTTTTTVEAGETTSTAPDETTTSAAAPSSGSGETVTFVIDQTQSTARFELDEELRGSPTHVVGTTDQVVGQVRVDLSDTSNSQLSDVVINARTFTTGSGNRDRAIRGPVILDSGSDANELITFVVNSVEGLGGPVAVGDALEFAILGDLTIKGNTQPVTFDVVASLVDDSTIEGTAEAQVTRDMFEIGIPSVPGVANVTNDVLIALDFVAVAG